MLTIKNQPANYGIQHHDIGSRQHVQATQQRWSLNHFVLARSVFSDFLRAGLAMFLAAAIGLLLAGCKPAGPRAIFEGKRLIDEEKFPQAVEKLKLATTLIPTNAHAWNYLGIALHHSGQLAEAEKAYQRALFLNQDLCEAHYNLGCLFLTQNKLEPSRIELTAYTLRRPTSVEGLAQLANAQIRTAATDASALTRVKELNAAEKNLNEALRLSSKSPEVWNGVGMLRVLRGHFAEAAQAFSQALKQQSNFAPALLNLAIVSQQYIKDRPFALQKYREYVALKPAPENVEAVKIVSRQLETEINATARPQATNEVPAPVSSTNAGLTTNPVTASNAPRSNLAASPELASVTPKPPGSNISHPSATNPLVSPKASHASTPDQPKPSVEPGRFPYQSPSKPVSGNRASAEPYFSQGVQAQQSHRVADAILAYRKAVQLDPSYFEARYNLGLAETESGNLQAAAATYETALASRPDSIDSRYNFALVLKQSNYLLDAASELQKILATNPNELRAHLALGNLYAQQLHQPSDARKHYLKVLEEDPNHPQANTIRYWLKDNP
jgi:Flp pilus assembly protein TadD